MKTIVGHIKVLVADPLFLRVCVFIWGVPFGTFGLYFAFQVEPAEAIEWFGFALLLLVAVFGLYLMTTAALGSIEAIVRAAGFTSDGGDIIGLLFLVAVLLVALPLTALLRALFVRRNP